MENLKPFNVCTIAKTAAKENSSFNYSSEKVSTFSNSKAVWEKKKEGMSFSSFTFILGIWASDLSDRTSLCRNRGPTSWFVPERDKCHKTRKEAISQFVVADLAEVLSSKTFIMARRYRRMYKCCFGFSVFLK